MCGLTFLQMLGFVNRLSASLSHSSGSSRTAICQSSSVFPDSSDSSIPLILSLYGPLAMLPAVVVMTVNGSLRGPMELFTVSTRLAMSLFSFTYSALPNSSARQRLANSPSLVLPPALSTLILL